MRSLLEDAEDKVGSDRGVACRGLDHSHAAVSVGQKVLVDPLRGKGDVDDPVGEEMLMIMWEREEMLMIM